MNKTILPKPILAEAKKANSRFGLVEKRDKILLAFSGGKDSTALIYLFDYYQKGLRMDFEFKPVIINYGSGSDEDEKLEKIKKDIFEKIGVKVEIFETNIFEIIEQKKNKNKSVCSFLARLRRGMLYKKAQEWGANKLAIGHHLDDAIQTTLMSMFYTGSLRSMPPKYQAENGLEIIRPLIFIQEKDIEYFVRKNKISVIGNEFCLGLNGEKKSHVRAEIKELIKNLVKNNPKFYSSVKNAFQNLAPETFFVSKNKK